MSDAPELSELDHLEILFYLRKNTLKKVYEPSNLSEFENIHFPWPATFKNAGDLWGEVAKQIGGEGGIADQVKKELDKVLEVWKGEAAEAFKAKVNEVIFYAYQLARVCDTDIVVPDGVDPTDTLERAETADLTEGYKQVLHRLRDQVADALTYQKSPNLPWVGDNRQRAAYSLTLEPCQPGLFGISYQFKKNGEDVDMPTRGAGGPVPESSMWRHYERAGIETTSYGGNDSERGYAYGSYVRVFLPKNDWDWHKFFIYSGFNKNEEETCKETARQLNEDYTKGGQDLPSPPKKVPQIGGGQGVDYPGGGGGPGSGPGGGPGFPSGDPMGPKQPPSPELPDTPKGPDDSWDPSDPPEIPEDPSHEDPHIPPLPPEPPDPRDPDGPHEKFPNDPPNEFPRRPDSDGDGIPDDIDPFPNDPDHDGNGIPDGEEWPGGGYPDGDYDTGTETARAGGLPGGGGPGLGGGSALGTGPAAGSISGGPGAGGVGAGIAGAGVGGAAPGVAGGGAGAGSAGAGMRGGMMPMMGAGMAGQDGGQEQQRNTWLDEDEDVWGADDDAPPPVLGGGL